LGVRCGREIARESALGAHAKPSAHTESRRRTPAAYPRMKKPARQSVCRFSRRAN
jgi:hypothetical protein